MKREETWLLEQKYNGEETAEFLADLKRLQNGEPVAYLIGWIPFLDTKIHLDSRPLIPRPETEFWVEEALQRIIGISARLKRPLRVLDLCAGSGCIGVAVAKAVPDCLVDLAELDVNHHSTIRKNLTENNIIPERCKIFGGDLFEQVYRKYDFILSNPPYINIDDDRSEQSVREYEPHGALYGGSEGLEIIFNIINQAKSFLEPNGQLWIEHEPEQVELVRALANTREFLCQVGHDQYKTARFSKLTVE